MSRFERTARRREGDLNHRDPLDWRVSHQRLDPIRLVGNGECPPVTEADFAFRSNLRVWGRSSSRFCSWPRAGLVWRFCGGNARHFWSKLTVGVVTGGQKVLAGGALCPLVARSAGRVLGLRIRCRKAWGFKSPLSHHPFPFIWYQTVRLCASHSARKRPSRSALSDDQSPDSTTLRLR